MAAANTGCIVPNPLIPGTLGKAENPWPRIYAEDILTDGKSLPGRVSSIEEAIRTQGYDLTQYASLGARVVQLEKISDDIVAHQLASGEYPDFNMLLYGTFSGKSLADVERIAVAVTSASAGDDTLDVENMGGLIPGHVYTITDGELQEDIVIKNCVKVGSVYRILLEAPLAHTYSLSTATIYRTTAGVAMGKAYGSGLATTASWTPGITWQGLGSAAKTTIMLESTMNAAGKFDIEGDGTFDVDGFMTLDTSKKYNDSIGIALVELGGGNGMWAWVDEEGDDLNGY